MRILLAEDEKAMAMAVVAVLKHEGYEVDAVADGKAATEQAAAHAYDAMVFDIMMPLMDGVTALTKIREAGNRTPVILLTAKAEVDDRIEGLDAGADDYLAKPFAMGELLARLRSLIRRNQTDSANLTLGAVTLDVEQQELSAKSSIRLASKETQLLQLLMANAGKPFTTEALADRVWHGEEADASVVYLYISYLREKLAAVGGDLAITGEQGGSFQLAVAP